jgi:hypothetical protein
MRFFVIAAGFAFAITATFAPGQAKADTLMSDGKCWLNPNPKPNRNPEWGACPKETHHKAKHHAKAAHHGKEKHHAEAKHHDHKG